MTFATGQFTKETPANEMERRVAVMEARISYLEDTVAKHTMEIYPRSQGCKDGVKQWDTLEEARKIYEARLRNYKDGQEVFERTKDRYMEALKSLQTLLEEEGKGI